jgi:hypothetical protein
MDVLSILPQIQAALAGVVIVARILLLVATRRERAARGSAGSASIRENASPRRSSRTVQVVLATAQTINAILTVIAWLHSAGLI